MGIAKWVPKWGSLQCTMFNDCLKRPICPDFRRNTAANRFLRENAPSQTKCFATLMDFYSSGLRNVVLFKPLTSFITNPFATLISEISYWKLTIFAALVQQFVCSTVLAGWAALWAMLAASIPLCLRNMHILSKYYAFFCRQDSLETLHLREYTIGEKTCQKNLGEKW